jgi:hypothetical protein
VEAEQDNKMDGAHVSKLYLVPEGRFDLEQTAVCERQKLKKEDYYINNYFCNKNKNHFIFYKPKLK